MSVVVFAQTNLSFFSSCLQFGTLVHAHLHWPKEEAARKHSLWDRLLVKSKRAEWVGIDSFEIYPQFVLQYWNNNHNCPAVWKCELRNYTKPWLGREYSACFLVKCSCGALADFSICKWVWWEWVQLSEFMSASLTPSQKLKVKPFRFLMLRENGN